MQISSKKSNNLIYKREKGPEEAFLKRRHKCLKGMEKVLNITNQRNAKKSHSLNPRKILNIIIIAPLWERYSYHLHSIDEETDSSEDKFAWAESGQNRAVDLAAEPVCEFAPQPW